MSRAEIIAGDCIRVLGELATGSVNLVFADPPYDVGVDYDRHDDRMKPADYLAWCAEWIDASVKALARDGSMWVLINDEWADEYAGQSMYPLARQFHVAENTIRAIVTGRTWCDA